MCAQELGANLPFTNESLCYACVSYNLPNVSCVNYDQYETCVCVVGGGGGGGFFVHMEEKKKF